MTIETLEAKVDELLALARAPIILPPNEPAKAYDRPSLSSAQVTADGKFVNLDGSIWHNVKFEVDPATGKYGPVPGGGRLDRSTFGYISPIKTPALWDLALRVLGEVSFTRWDAEWQAHPFALYKIDVSELEQKGTPVNGLLFSYLMQPGRTWVQ